MMNIAICPGHTVIARGAVNHKYGINEHDEAVKVAMNLMELATRAGHNPRYIAGSLTHKVEEINAGNYQLALDIHFNADNDHLDPDDIDDSRGSGVMIMYYPHAKTYIAREPESIQRTRAATASKAMAEYLEEQDLGARPGWYWGKLENGIPIHKDYFLRKTVCPSAIPELGYIDNNAFSKRWLISNKHDKLAIAIMLGLESTIREAKG